MFRNILQFIHSGEDEMSKIIIHQCHEKIADFESIFNVLESNLQNKEKALHIYPELFLSGYPLQDLCLQKSFYETYQRFLKKINEYSSNLKESDSLHLLGGLYYEFSESGITQRIENSMYALSPGSSLEKLYSKRLLPNYDIFDERKYFTPGETHKSIKWNGLNIGLLICEDMWQSVHYKANPVGDLINSSEDYDLIVNISASPFGITKNESRIAQAQDISNTLRAPFAYVNMVAEQDEVLFDGGSFMVNGNEVTQQAKFFQADQIEIPFKDLKKTTYDDDGVEITHSWESLFKPRVNITDKSAELIALTETQKEHILKGTTFAIREYAKQNGFNKFQLALSGGLDSSLALALIKLALKDDMSVEAIYMPSEYSSNTSLELSEQLCKNLNVPFKVLPIKPIHSMVRETFKDYFEEPFEGLPDENIQARLRGALIYARSNQSGSLVINTSNKSEIAVGYSTLYGDSVGAFSIIGDLYKTEAFDLCHYINKVHDNIIPEEIITRKPTAELRENQLDTDSLPPYPILDAILECILSYRYDRSDLIDMGFDARYVDLVLKLYARSEFKRMQFCPIIKLKTKSFGFGYRIPINKHTGFYFD